MLRRWPANILSRWIRRADGHPCQLRQAEIGKRSRPLAGSIFADHAPKVIYQWIPYSGALVLLRQGVEIRALRQRTSHSEARQTARMARQANHTARRHCARSIRRNWKHGTGCDELGSSLHPDRTGRNLCRRDPPAYGVDLARRIRSRLRTASRSSRDTATYSTRTSGPPATTIDWRGDAEPASGACVAIARDDNRLTRLTAEPCQVASKRRAARPRSR